MKIGMMIKCNTPMMNVVIRSLVNNVNFIQQQIASGRLYYISLTLNAEIGVMVKLNTPKINIVIKSLNLVKNSLRLVLPYLTNRSSTKHGNWCDGKY